MKKIISGLLGIVATLALVGGVAYAVTFGHVTANATATTQNDLLIYDNGTTSYLQDISLSGDAFSNLTTVGNRKVLFFKNQTNANIVNITAKQIGGISGDGGAHILVAFADGDVTTPGTFSSLTDWTSGGGNIFPSPITFLANTQDHPVTMFVKLDSTTPAGYSVSGIQFDFGPAY
jgi:hypothetical protein